MTLLSTLMLRLLAAVLLPALLAPATFAQTCTTSWTNPAGGAWETETNWDAGVPAPSDVACITLGGTYTVAQSRTNRAVAGLVVGGASGTQTLTTNNVFTIAGDGVIRPNGVVEVINRVPGAGDGVYTTGTLTVEGLLLYGGSDLLSDGGTLDVAPGGTLRIADNAGAGGSAATFRIRGLLESVGTGTSQVGGALDVQGGTILASAGQLVLNGGGLLRDATLDAVAGATLRIGRPGVFTVTGTLAGAPAGRVVLGDTRFQAGPGDATLAFGGTGLVFDGSSGTQYSTIAGAGGRFINTGLLTWEDSFAIASAVVIENRGTLRSLEGVSLDQGARLLNRPGATWELATSSGMGFGTGTVENAGLIVKTGAGSTNFGGRLRNLPGAEMRALNGRLDLAAPASQMLPDGVTVTGTAEVFFPSALEIEGVVSPGTEAQPVATLVAGATYHVSLVAGSPRLVIDVDAGGVSDVLAISAGGGTPNIPRLGGTLVVRVRPGFTPAVGDVWTVLTSTRAMTGQFAQVVAEGAPPGVAFVTEIPADARSVVVRAVETAPGGPITFSTTAPVGGGVRPVFLTGPGVVGVSAARLECAGCLDPSAFGQIAATLVGSGALVEARFDLTHPRIVGGYTLVVQRPGQPDVSVPVTVRPYLAFALATGGVARGARVRPPGMGYNYTTMNIALRSNLPVAAFHAPRVTRVQPDLFAVALATGNPFSSGVVFYESDTSADPERAPLVVGRLTPAAGTPITFGLRISPEDVLFPEQTPTGPDDPRVPFGQPRLVAVAGAQHLSVARVTAAIGAALRGSGHAPLTAYIASLEATDPTAVARITPGVLEGNARGYYTSPADPLAALLAAYGSVVPPPSGLAAAARAAFGEAFEAALDAASRDIDAALEEALAAGGPLGTLIQTEVDALFPEGLGDEVGRPGTAARTDYTAIENLLCFIGFGDSIRSIKGIPGGKPGGGGGGACEPPAAPADPNDKTTLVAGLCEIGTVIVDGQPVTRCVRNYVPLAEATEPLFYTVSFENLPQATANAEFVTITDVLDPNLDPASLVVSATSSDSTFSYSVTGQTVTFRFVGIDLPPNVTAPEGEGFVSFSVRPRPGLTEGTEIRNDASIVFDFNPPIETPEVVHELRRTLDLGVIVEAPSSVEIGAEVPVRVAFANLRGDPSDEVTLTIAAPGLVLSGAAPSMGTCVGAGPIVCTLPALDAGEEGTVDLRVRATAPGSFDLGATIATAAFDAFARNDTDGVRLDAVTVGTADGPDVLTAPTLAVPRPNPARGPVALRFGRPTPGRADVRVFDLLGREVAVVADDAPVDGGWTEVTWPADVASGVYVIRFATEWNGRPEVQVRRVVVMR